MIPTWTKLQLARIIRNPIWGSCSTYLSIHQMNDWPPHHHWPDLKAKSNLGIHVGSGKSNDMNIIPRYNPRWFQLHHHKLDPEKVQPDVCQVWLVFKIKPPTNKKRSTSTAPDCTYILTYMQTFRELLCLCTDGLDDILLYFLYYIITWSQ